MPQKDPAKLTRVRVSLPFGLGSAEWESDKTERRAAWSLYVELVTRISIQPLGEEEGVLREALASLHSIFGTTREILKESGPDVGASKNSVGGIAITVLNKGLRPILSKWHPRLQAWNTQRDPGISPQEHEKQWPEEPQLRQEMEDLHKELKIYADVLSIIAGVDQSMK